MYKLVFGPKAFVVVSDPVVVRHILKVKRRNSGTPQTSYSGQCAPLLRLHALL